MKVFIIPYCYLNNIKQEKTFMILVSLKRKFISTSSVARGHFSHYTGFMNIIIWMPNIYYALKSKTDFINDTFFRIQKKGRHPPII